MKRLTLLTTFLILLSTYSFSQASIAKLKFEEAEEAFAKADYSTTLSKLNEAENLLGASNPRILFLRICAEYKVITQDPYTDYSKITEAKAHCDKYLKDADGVENLEEKFKEVYKISEGLKTIAPSEAAWATKRRKAEELRATESRKIELANDMLRFAEENKFKPGLTIEEMKTYNPEFAELMNNTGQVIENNEGIHYNRKFKLIGNPWPEGKIAWARVKNGKVVAISWALKSGKNEWKEQNAIWQNRIQQASARFGGNSYTKEADFAASNNYRFSVEGSQVSFLLTLRDEMPGFKWTGVFLTLETR